jgi:hypothetical protein
MSSRQITGISLAALFGAGAILVSTAAAEAAMSPPATDATTNIHRVDCAVGAHLGPLGACVLGEPEHDNGVVIEHRSVDEPRDGCRTKTVKKTDEMGNSMTKSRTDCD